MTEPTRPLSEKLKRWCGIGGGDTRDYHELINAFAELTDTERHEVAKYFQHLYSTMQKRKMS